MSDEKNSQNVQTTHQVVRVKGKLKEIVTVRDEAGNILHKIMAPLMVEFYLRDVLQVIIGATILAIPIAFTEETWRLGENLPTSNIVAIGIISIIFMGLFVYYNSYRENLNGNLFHFAKRVIATYILSFLVVAMILTLIEKANWTSDHILAIKRIIIVTFPASMSAAIADGLK